MNPPPFSFAPSQFWEGSDGPWSTFAIRIGTPAQTFRVLPSTAGQEIWIPAPEACTEEDPADCAQRRGAFTSTFNNNTSSTWKGLGIYDLHLEKELDYRGNGVYGLDTVGLQISRSGGIELQNQVVAGIETQDFYLGSFGLGVKPINFTNLDDPQPSFMQALKNQNMIPSLSYGYTAGASYKQPNVFGSLTLGGYDKSRFIGSQTKYPFDPDDSRPLSIFIESITTSNPLQGETTLLNNSNKAYAVIDSTIPHLWLPRSVCDGFEVAFNLQYDPVTDLYRINSTTRQELLKMNISIAIELGYDTTSLNKTTITLPYNAFDLQASNPIYPNPTYYFPIRRAANASHYRLGRVFLQEAYLITDYEGSQFSIHQARFETPMPEQSLIAITSPTNSTNTTQQSHKPSETSLSRGEIAGIAVGSWIGLAISIILLLYLVRHRHKQKADTTPEIHEEPRVQLTFFSELPDVKEPYYPELQSVSVHEMPEPPVYEMYVAPSEMRDCKSPVT